MPTPNHNDDLFSASLESLSTSKRVDKYQRFKNDFLRECNATLNNAQEWIKAELPIVTDYIDPALIKDELRQSKTSDRRKYLLSALLLEKSLRESINSNDAKKANTQNKKKVDTWAEEVEQDKKRKLAALARKNELKNLSKKKAASVLSKVKTKLPLIKKGKKSLNKPADNQTDSNNIFNEDLLDDPNRSSIMVSDGFADNIEDSIIKAREEIFRDPNASGVKVHKILKKREHEKQEPGSNTIIMKLASSSSKKPGAKLSIPEQCQEAINMLTEQFPGYDMVAIRNMAAEKVGVSPQYIENLNILPEKAG